MPYMLEGQRSSGAKVVNAPMQRTVPGENAAQEPGAVTDKGFAYTGTGYMPVPSWDVKQRIEDSPLEWIWALRNFLGPVMSQAAERRGAPPFSPGPGKIWWSMVWSIRAGPRHRIGSGACPAESEVSAWLSERRLVI